MRAITCEMCGSRDLIKSDGLYVCQNCGTKYSPQEAVKLVAEISGPITIDRTAELENYVILARRAVAGKDYVKAKEYYATVLLINARCWEAELYILVYNAINSGTPFGNRDLIKETIVTALDDAKKNLETEEQNEFLDSAFKVLKVLTDYLNKRAIAICYEAERGNKGSKQQSTVLTEQTNRCPDAVPFIEFAVDVFETFGMNVSSLFGNDHKDYVLSAYTICFEIYNRFYDSVDGLNDERRIRIINYLSDNDPTFRAKYLKDSSLKRLDRMITYFSKKQQLYDEIENLKAQIASADGNALQELTVKKKGFIKTVVGWVIFGIGAYFAIAFDICSYPCFSEGIVGIGILLILLSCIVVAPGVALIVIGGRQKREYYAEYKRVKQNNDLIRERNAVQSRLSMVTSELASYHRKFQECEVSLSDSNPKVLRKIKDVILKGNAYTIEDAMDYYHKRGNA